MAASGNKFTFLNYESPDHNASHRKVVKAHISSKYRTTVRQHDQPRYALPQRLLHTSLPGADTGGESGTGSATSARKKKKQKQDLVQATEEISRRPLSLLEVGFQGTRVDPFNVLPGQWTPCVLSATDYYTQAHIPLYRPMLLALNVINPALTWTFPLFQTHEDAFHGIIAVCQAYIEQSRAPTSKPSKEVQFHRYKAASTLRAKMARLDGPPDDAAILAVLALACLDILFQEPYAMNRDGLGLLVAMRGGLNSLGENGMVKAYLVQFDYFWMLETNSPTIFPLSRRKEHRKYHQHPLSPDIIALIDVMPPGLRAIAIQNTLGVDVMQILSRVSRYVMTKSSGYRHAAEEATVSDGQEYPDIFDACSCLHLTPSTEHSLEKHLCLAVILFSFDVYNPMTKGSQNLAPYRGSRQELARSLPVSEFRTPEERNCLIFIWIIAIGSWRVDGILDTKGLLMSGVFFDKFDEAGSWDQIESILRQFWWDEQLARVWRLCWQEAFHYYQGQLSTHPLELISTTPAENLFAGKTFAVDLPEKARPGESASMGPTSIPSMLTLENFVSQLH